jgi:hypothetical protein
MKHIAIAALLGIGLAAPAFAFDDEYLDRRDTLTKGAGDAQAVNAATQTLDPWPPYARNTDIKVDGKRAELGMTRYQKNKSIEPRGLTTSSISPAKSGGGAAATSK